MPVRGWGARTEGWLCTGRVDDQREATECVAFDVAERPPGGGGARYPRVAETEG